MATYHAIDSELRTRKMGQGIKESDQAVFARRNNTEIGDGVCAGLVCLWLRSRKANKNFWEMSEDTKTTPLLGEYKALDAAKEIQALNGWDKGYSELTKYGIIKCDETPYPMGICAFSMAIAKEVFENKHCYFALSLYGEEMHETAFHRPDGFFGKNTTARFYDPNYGEFEVTKEGAAYVLSTIGHAHPKMNKVCILRILSG